MFNYIKNILTLSGGTLTSQLILVFSIPFITRIYNPSDLGLTASFLAISNIISSISTGKYDLAIFLPKNKIWINNLFFGSILINLVLLTIFTLLVIPLKFLLNNYFSFNIVWYLSIPILFFLNGFNSSLSAILNKNNLYKQISISRIIKNIILTFLTILLGMFFYKPIFIIVSHILSLVVANLYLISISLRGNIFNIKYFNFRRIITLFKKYKHFPKYSLPASFINIISNQAPVIMLSFYFGTSISGIYSLVIRVMGAPSKLVSSATSEVFRQKASEEYNIKGNCKDLYLKTFKGLFYLSVIPFIIIVVSGPKLFLHVFGNEWLSAGYYARYLSLFFLLRFCISPLGFTLIISNRQDYNLYWQFILLILTNIGLFIGFYFNDSNYSIICFSTIYSIMYLFYFLETYKSSQGSNL